MPSNVWKCFKKVGDKAICVCGAELKLSKCNSTSGMTGRLESTKHKEAMEKKEDGPSAPKKAKTESVADLFNPSYSKQQSQELTSDLTDFIVDSNLPFSIAESPFIRRLIKHSYGQAKSEPSQCQCNKSVVYGRKARRNAQQVFEGEDAVKIMNRL